MSPEVDVVPAHKVTGDALPDTRWKADLASNQIVFKIHWHGVIYVPGMTPKKIGDAFKTTPGGKRSKYAGSMQVRSQTVDVVAKHGCNVPDIEGCLGYAEKRHYRPANTEMPLQAFADWLWLANRIVTNESRVIIGGFKKGIKEVCGFCDGMIDHGAECGCRANVKSWFEEFYGDEEGKSGDSGSIPQEYNKKVLSLGNDNILNCTEASIWDALLLPVKKTWDWLSVVYRGFRVKSETEPRNPQGP